MTTDPKSLLPEDECRKAFEFWYWKGGDLPYGERQADGSYLGFNADLAWESWQAAWNARPTQPLAGLVGKLQRHHDSIPHDDRNADALGKRAGVSEAINIIRTHQPVISEERRKELTEQVAIAISAWRWDRKSDEPWDSINEPVKKAYRDQAKAALSIVLKELGGEG